jgi:tetratricopeptide (TPR) repeat protein
MKMDKNDRGRCLGAGALLLALVALCIPQLADAGVNFTSGKVYVQQKVYDKACRFLELARLEEPENPQVYSLLAFARSRQRQYASAGAVFELGLKVAADKKDKKRQEEMTKNRESVIAELFNPGVRALTRAGGVEQKDTRTTDAGTPQAALEKERGEPKDMGRFTEGGKVHEFWYYPDGVAFHFSPGGTEPLQFSYKPFTGPADPKVAVTDTTVFPPYSGASAIAEAAYAFEMAMLVDEKSSDIYKNLSYVYGVLGRPDDAIRAAQVGLSLKPDDKQLMQNLRVAAMGRGNRLFADKKYVDAIPAYHAAMAFDSAGTIMYLSRIAESYQLAAEPMKEGAAGRDSLLNNAANTYMLVVEKASPDSAGMWAKENSLYNAAVIQMTLNKYPSAVEILEKGVAMFPKSKELLSLSGQAKFQTNDFNGTVAAMRKVLELDPKDKDAHQFLFLALNKLNKRDESVAEYTVYKALNDGKQRLGPQLKTWVDSADNRLGAGHQLKKTVNADGYPDEVRTFSDGDKTLESWFYWTKGKSITFLEGQVFSQATFPPVKQ